MKRFFFIGLLALLLPVVGCGRKTPPVPPQTALPAPIEDLTYMVKGKDLILSWSCPQYQESGEPLERVGGFEVLRAMVAEVDYCGGCPLPFVEVAELDFTGDPRNQVHYTEYGLKAGFRYFYKVRSRQGSRGISRDSNQVSLVWRISSQASL